MMGDEMAIRSGGMYGNPESQYTLAQPSSAEMSNSSAFTMFGRFARGVIQLGAASRQGAEERTQARAKIRALVKERDYNIANFEQTIADTMASNKMSFYSSGLDLSSGSAMDMIMSNRTALQKDLSMMSYNYNMQEKNLKNEIKASRTRQKANEINAIASIF